MQIYNELQKRWEVVITGSAAVKCLTTWTGIPNDLDLIVIGDANLVKKNCASIAEKHLLRFENNAFWEGDVKLVDVTIREKNKKYRALSTVEKTIEGVVCVFLAPESLLRVYLDNARPEDRDKISSLRESQ
jgi:hypothetical protein